MTKPLNLGFKDLTWLGHAFEELSIISPFKLVDVGGFDEGDKVSLMDKGVIGEDNRILPQYHPLLKTLADADYFVETIFRRGPVKARRLHLGNDTGTVSVTYNEDGVSLLSPANPQGMVNFLREYTGGSSLTGGDLDIELPPADMVVFAVICDLYRRAVFAAYSSEEIFQYRGFTAGDLLTAVTEVRDNSQSLAYHVKALVRPGLSFDSASIEQTLKTFIESGFLKTDDHRFYPVDETLLFCGNFLVIENSLDVVVGQVDDGKLYRSGFTALQAGPLDLVMLEGSGETVTLQCLPAQSILSILTEILSSRPAIV